MKFLRETVEKKDLSGILDFGNKSLLLNYIQF